MAARRQKIDYGIDDSVDLFTGLTWPAVFLQDPSYAIFRPIYDRTSPWRTNHEKLWLYLNSQARRLGSRRMLLYHFANLQLIANGFPIFQAFLLNPFSRHDLNQLFSEIERFLRWRFDQFSDDPWRDYPVQEKVSTKKIQEKDLIVPTLTEQARRKLLKKELSKISWQTQLQRSLEYDTGIEGFHASLVEKAIRECPDLLKQKSNEDLVTEAFSPSDMPVTIVIGKDGWTVTEIPVMLGSHYLAKRTQKVWFDDRNRQFFKILGCYAKWLDAKLVIFTNTIHNDSVKLKQMFDGIKENHNLITVGNWNKMQIDEVDYFLSLLIESDMPMKSFIVSEWQINIPKLAVILEKDT